ncbi:MAG TPA: tetratricopeptide repeat protein [bacterium]|nr:tetratricopeptide repeat protein [bacterium]
MGRLNIASRLLFSSSLVFLLLLSHCVLLSQYSENYGNGLSTPLEDAMQKESDVTSPGDEFDLSGDPYEIAGNEDPIKIASQFYNRAVELHLAGNIFEAITFYKNAIVLNPEIAAYHADLGEAHRAIGQTREAIIELETAIELEPSLVNAYTTLGVILDRENLPHKAVKLHREAIKRDPTSYVAYNNLGHAYDSLGLIRAAIANYEKSIELKQDFAPAYDNLGTDLMRIGRADEAIDILKKCVNYAGEKHPQLGLYYNDLGAAYVMKNEFGSAYSAFEKATKLAPGNADIQRNFDFIHEHLYGENN